MKEDNMFVKIAPTTYFKTPECYSSWIMTIDMRSEKCRLCPVRLPCSERVTPVKEEDIVKDLTRTIQNGKII